MTIEKLDDGVKVFVRNRIYGEKSFYMAYPTSLHTSEERKRTEKAKSYEAGIPMRVMFDEFRNFMDEIPEDK